MGRLANTWKLAKVSWRVLQKDRELMLLPVLSVISWLVVAAVFVVPMFILSDTGTEESVSPAVYVLGFLAAMALSIVTVFFTGALVAGAHERLSGGDPTVSSSMRRAMSRISGLVPWAILTATVGMILRALRERAGFLGNIISAIGGIAWEVASFLTIPAIMIDDLGAIDSLKKSGSLLRETWGENLAARVGFGLLGMVAVIPAVIVVALAGSVGGPLLIAGVIIAVIYLAVVFSTITAMSAIFQTALYLYATSGQVPADFADSNLRDSFAQK
jgi:hypothetical protein